MLDPPVAAAWDAELAQLEELSPDGWEQELDGLTLAASDTYEAGELVDAPEEGGLPGEAPAMQADVEIGERLGRGRQRSHRRLADCASWIASRPERYYPCIADWFRCIGKGSGARDRV